MSTTPTLSVTPEENKADITDPENTTTSITPMPIIAEQNEVENDNYGQEAEGPSKPEETDSKK
jgi:hypothetical protein